MSAPMQENMTRDFKSEIISVKELKAPLKNNGPYEYSPLLISTYLFQNSDLLSK
jgi:hypothetical protein